MLRDVAPDDWPEILELANASVAHVPEAGPQDEWYDNRRAFDAANRVQAQYVFDEDGVLVGYGAVESAQHGEFRMFIVTESPRLPQVGEALYRKALSILAQQNAVRVWFTEYAGDAPLIDFARAHGFVEVQRSHKHIKEL